MAERPAPTDPQRLAVGVAQIEVGGLASGFHLHQGRLSCSRA
jgi:hypothetical protein